LLLRSELCKHHVIKLISYIGRKSSSDRYLSSKLDFPSLAAMYLTMSDRTIGLWITPFPVVVYPWILFFMPDTLTSSGLHDTRLPVRPELPALLYESNPHRVRKITPTRVRKTVETGLPTQGSRQAVPGEAGRVHDFTQ